MQWFNPFEDGDNGGGGGSGYVLPTATGLRLGGVKIGGGISVESDGTISQNSAGEKIDDGIVTRYNYVDYTSGDGGEIFNDYENNKVAGNYAHAEGSNNKALGNNSHVEGSANAATAANAHAEGTENTVSAANAHAEGYQNSAQGVFSHAEGWGTETYQSGVAAHAEGYQTHASTYAHAEGNGSVASAEGSHAENKGYARGNYSHSEGLTTTYGLYSHAEGESNTASGRASHTEGYQTSTEANASYSHAEGNATVARAEASHAEGISSLAIGIASHAEGQFTKAQGNYSHAGNYGTTAYGEYQTAIGKYNRIDRNEKYAFIIGNGTGPEDSDSDLTSNAFAVDWDGKIYVGDSAIGKNVSELVPYEAGSGITLTPNYIVTTNDSRYDFSSQVSSTITDGTITRTFTKVNNKKAVGVVVKIINQDYTNNTVPIFISTDQSAVETTVEGYSNNTGEPFTFKGRTIYITTPNNGVLDGTISSGDLIMGRGLNYPYIESEIEKLFITIGANFEDLSTVISCDGGGSQYTAGQGISIDAAGGELVSTNDNYNFDYQASCTIGNYSRTFTKVNSDPAIGMVVQLVDSYSRYYSAPLFISGNADAVKYSADGTISPAVEYVDGYLGRTIYATFPGNAIEVAYGTTTSGNLTYYNPNGPAITWASTHYLLEDITNILTDLGAYWDNGELTISNTGILDIDYSNNNLQKTVGSTTSTILSVDTTPTENSTNLITSGAVYDAISSGSETNIQLDTSGFTKIYNSSIAYGNYGSYVAARLAVMDETQIAAFESGGWNQSGVPFYDAENIKGAYAGYTFGEALNISTVKIWLNRYNDHGTQSASLIATVQYLDGNNQWIDFQDCVIATDLPFPSYVFVLNLSAVGPIYGVRWNHYKDPIKSSANNIMFYGMTLYTSAGNELTSSQYNILSQEQKMNGTAYYIIDKGSIYKNDISYGSQDLIAEKETTVATDAHSIGDLFINDNKLLKATAAIAIGDTISNLNTVETTIADEMKILNGILTPLTQQEYNDLLVKDSPLYFIYEL